MFRKYSGVTVKAAAKAALFLTHIAEQSKLTSSLYGHVILIVELREKAYAPLMGIKVKGIRRI